MRVDYLIVGGGIGGAVLAKLLARAGRRCVILERDASPKAQLPRPEVLWPSTAEFLSTLVPRPAWTEATTPVRSLSITCRNRTLFAVRPPRSAGALLTDPSATRRLLLEGDDFEVRRGLTVCGLVRDGRRVVGVSARSTGHSGPTPTDAPQEVLEAGCVVGDDGGLSTVRQACGIALRVKSVSINLLCFEAKGEVASNPGHARVWINPQWARTGMFGLVCVTLPTGRTVGMVPARAWLLDDADATASAWNAMLGEAAGAPESLLSVRIPQAAARVRLSYGIADRYGIPGAYIIGDAAHPVTPAGGQGANLAIADAVALARAVTSGASEGAVLDLYERQRRPAALRSLRLSRGARLALALPDRLLAALVPLGFSVISRVPQEVLGRGVNIPVRSFETREPHFCTRWLAGFCS